MFLFCYNHQKIGVTIYSVNHEFYGEIEVKHSKFKAYIVPFSQFQEYNKNLRAQNPKANHVVWAYRHFNEYDQIVENSSDDGEPKNSSAPPILNVMRGEELINCAILVVRYFGGVKLGIGGLVRAYKGAAICVVEVAALVEYEKKRCVEFFCNYSEYSKVEYLLQNFQADFVEKEFEALGVLARVKIVEAKLQELHDALSPLVQSIKALDTK